LGQVEFNRIRRNLVPTRSGADHVYDHLINAGGRQQAGELVHLQNATAGDAAVGERLVARSVAGRVDVEIGARVRGVQLDRQRVAGHRVQLVAVEVAAHDLAIHSRARPAGEIDMLASRIGLGRGSGRHGRKRGQNGKRVSERPCHGLQSFPFRRIGAAPFRISKCDWPSAGWLNSPPFG
jgi:hypothetical protein